jgi:hypothetical protein
MWWGINEAINLHEIKGRGVDVRGWRDGLVAVAVKIEVGIGIAGCVITAAADTVTVVARRDVLDAKNYAA